MLAPLGPNTSALEFAGNNVITLFDVPGFPDAHAYDRLRHQYPPIRTMKERIESSIEKIMKKRPNYFLHPLSWLPQDLGAEWTRVVGTFNLSKGKLLNLNINFNDDDDDDTPHPDVDEMLQQRELHGTIDYSNVYQYATGRAPFDPRISQECRLKSVEHV